VSLGDGGAAVLAVAEAEHVLRPWRSTHAGRPRRVRTHVTLRHPLLGSAEVERASIAAEGWRVRERLPLGG
jgi:hypothetical protein